MYKTLICHMELYINILDVVEVNKSWGATGL